MSDAVDAIVVAEALAAVRATKVTSDACEIGRLVEADEAGRGVYVEAIWICWLSRRDTRR
jgi:hypothetical protein